MKITKERKWVDILPLAKEVTDGKWVNDKTGKIVTVLSRTSPIGSWGSIKILHSSGLVTLKKDHYFSGDYSPYTENK